MTFESLTKYNEIFLGRYNKNLPPPRDSSRELLILHQDPSETVSNEDGKANTCKPTCEKGSTSECISVDEYKRKCCMAKHFFHCEKREAVNTSLFSAKALSMTDNMTIHGIYFTFTKFVPPSMYVYVTENKEEAHLYYKNKTGNVRGEMDFNDGRSFAFHKCLGCYVFYEYDQKYLRSKVKDNDLVIAKDSLPRKISDENEYSIMLYYTQELFNETFLNNLENLEVGVHFNVKL